MNEVFELLDVHVTSQVDGHRVPAKLVICKNCGTREFQIFFILVGSENHQHLQCFECGETYCDGKCAENMEVE